MWWKEPVTSLKGIGPKKAADLAELNIYTLGDLLCYYPRQEAYIDYSKLKTIRELDVDGSKQIFTATVFRIRDSFQGRGRKFTVVTVRDETGYADLYFFMNQRYMAKKLKIDERLMITGRVKQGRSAKMVSEVFYQTAESADALTGIWPVYSLSGALTQKNMRQWIKNAIERAERDLPESLPDYVINECNFTDRLTALQNIHFPRDWNSLKQAQRRFIFEELFLLQCGLLYYRQSNESAKVGIKHSRDGKILQQLIEQLPFKLTAEQQKAWQEISLDMQDIKPMHRILQGDVGSGKTVISALALAKAVENGFQGCMMAPTEILAVQHYKTLKEYFAPLGIRIGILTGSLKAKARKELLEALAVGTVDVVVGTHALLQEDVVFQKLSVVITDEQHRFGVGQRAALANKGQDVPDVLVMTATPIPRTLALTVYGDLEVSLIKSRPPGRRKIQTLCYTEEKRSEVYAGLRRQVQKGRQAYVVCPLIQESESIGVRSAENVYQELSQGILQDVRCALLHGKLKDSEKNIIMTAFAAGEIDVLISTTVIEVGVNVPNAVLMVIENAERFGLAQLHQLRGRVGRGSEQSYCVLLTGADNPETLKRLQVLHDSDDGFYLAEQDLLLRGAGQLFGLRQHGLPDLRIADIIRDTEVIISARKFAHRLVLQNNNWELLRELIDRQFDNRFQMIFNS
mgnify:CR=1 FL=1